MIPKWLGKAFPDKINIGCFVAAMLVLIPFIVVMVKISISLRHYARVPVCADHMRQLGTAFAQYAQDNDGLLPLRQTRGGVNGAVISWRVPINQYVKNPVVFQCADNPAIGKNNDLERDGFSRSYAVNSTSDGKQRFGPFADRFSHGFRLSKVVNPENVVMLGETTAAYNDLNMLLPEAFAKPTNTQTNNGNLFAGHYGASSMALYCDGHTHLLSTKQMMDDQHQDIWTVDNKPFAAADRAKMKTILDYSIKEYR